MKQEKILEEDLELLARGFGTVDREALIVIKGHLLLEESLNFIIEKFVHHPANIERARLSFYQKVFLVKSMSVSNNDDNIWNLVEKLNSLRKDFAHNLESERRNDKIQIIRQLYEEEISEEYRGDWDNHEVAECLGFCFSLCLGFLKSFKAEVSRFRDIVDIMNKRFNNF